MLTIVRIASARSHATYPSWVPGLSASHSSRGLRIVARLAFELDPNTGALVSRHGPDLAIGVRSTVDGVCHHTVDRSVTRPTPHGLATRTLGGQIESVFQKPQQRLTGTAQLLNLVENQRNGLLNPAVRVFLQTITVLHIADRCGHDQLTALGLLVTGCQRALAQQIDFIFVELPFEPICSAARYVVQPVQPTVNARFFLTLPDIIFVLQIAFSCSSRPTVAFHRGSSPASPGQVDFIASSLALRSTSA